VWNLQVAFFKKNKKNREFFLFFKKNKKIENFFLRCSADAPEDEAICLFAGLLANPDVPLSPRLYL
jgi:hypothetical protein